MSNLYAYKTIFTIDSINSLEDFWSFIIFKLNLEQSQYTYDRFARLYNLLSEHKHELSEKSVIYIILEESNEKFFISIDTILRDFLELITSRLDALNFSYMYESNLLSYSINKKQVISTAPAGIKKNNYTFMDLHDLEEMRTILETMRIKNHEQTNTTLSKEELNDYKSMFTGYSSYLRYYPQLTTINNIIAELSVILSLYPQKCLDKGAESKELLNSFFKNLLTWQEKLFVQGSENLEFMDSTFKTELSKMKTLLNLYDELVQNNKNSFNDDVFDF